MIQGSSIRYWKLPIVSSLAMSGVITFYGSCALAQIKSDATLGAERSVVNRNLVIEGGARRGANLFHSFEEFNINEGQAAYFTNPKGIENILSRVTGAKRSDIQGTLGVLGKANLFLINPNGIVFGSSSSLDVRGSFVATTADAVQFGSQGFFNVSDPVDPGLLTINPSAFLFNQITAQSITNQSGVGLRVPTGKSLLLLGGDVSLNSYGLLLAPGGRVELGGVAGSGTVGLNANGSNLSLSFPDVLARANISVASGFISVVAGGGGSIVVNAKNLEVLAGSSVQAGIGEESGAVESQAGDITLNATGTMTIAANSFIANDTVGRSNAGNLQIEAGSLSLTDKAQLSTSTFGSGNAGGIFLQVDDAVSINNSFIFSQTLGQGNAGNLRIKAGSLSLSNNTQLSTSSSGLGDAGRVLLQADDSVNINNSLIFTAANEGAEGDGGNIRVESESLSLDNGAQLNASTAGFGDAGNLRIETGQLIIQDGSQVGVSSTRTAQDASDAGSIDVVADSILLDNKGKLIATSASGKRGGDIRLTDLNLLLLNRNSQISTTAGTQGGPGNGGNITINTDTLVGLENSDITANSFEGEGGFIQITSPGIFGLEVREPNKNTSDISAISQEDPSLNGVVEINTPDIDPKEGVVALSEQVVDVSGLVAQSCPAGRSAVARGRGDMSSGQATPTQIARNEFVATGRGGLPPTPKEALKDGTVLVDLGTPMVSAAKLSSASTVSSDQAASEELLPRAKGLTENDANSDSSNLTRSAATPIMEAQGWVRGPNGQVVLTAQAPTVAPDRSGLTSAACHGF